MASNYGLKNTDYGTTRNISDPSALIRAKLPNASWNDPAAIVDYFLGLLYPGEGVATSARIVRRASIFSTPMKPVPPPHLALPRTTAASAAWSRCSCASLDFRNNNSPQPCFVLWQM